jgi:hypothetical protein
MLDVEHAAGRKRVAGERDVILAVRRVGLTLRQAIVEVLADLVEIALAELLAHELARAEVLFTLFRVSDSLGEVHG